MPAAPLRYKVVLAPPDDTDPPSAPIWTVDDQIGINPPVIASTPLPTPFDFDAVGDGTTDDTVAMQAWLDAIAGGFGYGKAGTFAVSDTLTVSANTTIQGSGRNSFIIAKLDGFPATKALLINKNQVTSPTTAADSYVTWYDTCFKGIATDATTVDLVAYIGMSHAIFRDCKFCNHRYILLAITNIIDLVVDSCEFTDWGVSAVTSEGGPALWLDNSTNGVKIINNDFHDGEWSAMYVFGDNHQVSGNRIIDVHESAIFGTMRNVSITGNSIGSVVTKNISGNGIEIGGFKVTITGNTIDSTDQSSIHLTDPVDVTVTGNTCILAGEDTGVDLSACITCDTFDPTAAIWPDNVVISGNVVSGIDGNAGYGMLFINNNIGSALPATNFMVVNNNFGLEANWRHGPIYVGPSFLGDNCIIRGNVGTPNEDPSTVNFFIPSGSTGAKTIEGVGFKPRGITFQATIASTSNAVASLGQWGWLTGWTIGTGVTVTRAQSSNCIRWSAASGNARSFGESVAIMLVNAAGTTICNATVTSITDDGFVLTITGTTTADVLVNAICNP